MCARAEVVEEASMACPYAQGLEGRSVCSGVNLINGRDPGNATTKSSPKCVQCARTSALRQARRISDFDVLSLNQPTCYLLI
jgi:hypothetical protein